MTSLKPNSKKAVVVKDDEAEVIKALSSLIESKSQEVLNKNSTFNIGLSGGSMAKFLCKGLPGIR